MTEDAMIGMIIFLNKYSFVVALYFKYCATPVKNPMITATIIITLL